MEEGSLNFGKMKRVSSFGYGTIQPTLWKQENSVAALSRNFGNRQKLANVFYLEDITKWSLPLLTDIPNNNSSLHACNHKGKTYLIWNDTMNIERMRLSLGVISKVDDLLVCKPIGLLSRYGSYPSMLSHNEKLHITFTNRNRQIEYHEWTE